MSTNKFLTIANTGKDTLTTAISASTGATDASKIIATDSTGRIDPSLMPTGIGAETETIAATEALLAGDHVNIYNNGGTRGVRKASVDNGRPANGFVLANVSNGQNALVYKGGTNTSLTGLVPGTEYFLGNNGAVTATPAIAAPAQLIQSLGYASDTTEILFVFQSPTLIA